MIYSLSIYYSSCTGERAEYITADEKDSEGVGRGVGGTPHMKRWGMLVVSLKGLNFGFWSHLGCSGQNAIIFSREGLV